MAKQMKWRNLTSAGFICCGASWIALPLLCWILYADADSDIRQKSGKVFEAVRLVYEQGRHPEEFTAFKQLPLIAVGIRERYLGDFFLLWAFLGLGIGLIGLTLIGNEQKKKNDKPLDESRF